MRALIGRQLLNEIARGKGIITGPQGGWEDIYCAYTLGNGLL